MKFRECIILFSVTCVSLLADIQPYEYVGITGSFNSWNQTDEDYLMKFEGNNIYEIKKFFDNGDFEFKFVMNKGWETNMGVISNDTMLRQGGNNIKMHLDFPGIYRIKLDLNAQKYEFSESPPDKAMAAIIGQKICLGIVPNFEIINILSE